MYIYIYTCTYIYIYIHIYIYIYIYITDGVAWRLSEPLHFLKQVCYVPNLDLAIDPAVDSGSGHDGQIVSHVKVLPFCPFATEDLEE